jgi:predicted PurR-regulated permease PerM
MLKYACEYPVEVSMTRLMMIQFSMISTTLMEIGVIVALATGYDTLYPILLGVAVGFVLAIPASWIVAKQIVG